MTPRARSALLWGAIGALAFMVLAQGYVLVGGRVPLDLPGLVGVGVVLGAVVAGVAYATERRLLAKGRT